MSSTIQEAIANMASTSAALEKYCNDPKNYNSYGTQLLEQMSCQLHNLSKDLEEYKSYGGWL